MSDTLLIATRKGLFTFKRNAKDWTVAGDAFLGSPVTYAFQDRENNILYAALNLGHFGPKLHRSTDNAKSWQEITMPALPKVKGNDKAPSVFQIWVMAAADNGVLWAGTIPGALFFSTDYGNTWQLNKALWDMPQRAEWNGGGYDQPGIHSICIDPRDANRIAVAVSSGGVWLSEDGGQSWLPRAKGMRAEYMPPEQAYEENVQDPHLMVQCRSAPDIYWVQHHNGIFKSSNNLTDWQEYKAEAPSSFGFAVAVHPNDGDTAWFVPAVKDEYRYPKDGKLVVTRTRNGGKSFEVLDKGLPKVASYDLIYRHALDVDAEGQRLAMGSTTGGAWVSEDAGENWIELPARLPPVYAVRFA